ncbi:membrane-bound O-acyltransferase family MBOAT domain protein [Leptospira interrogans serovar Bataviae str. UI 08561]|nr:membrane-bound O-acyltransferase family MBOAT domain protein [Leptospira interrogans serovar Bataviae str. UI 08561]
MANSFGSRKKAVIADRISTISDFVYQFPESVSTFFAWMGVISYSIQIYCDFSGYTDIAIGSALLLGVRLPENFRLPYTATSFRIFGRDGIFLFLVGLGNIFIFLSEEIVFRILSHIEIF